MDDDLFRGALGLDSDEDDAGLPTEQPEEADPAAQRLHAAGLASDEDDQEMKPPLEDDKEELPQTPPVPGSPVEDSGGLKGAILSRVPSWTRHSLPVATITCWEHSSTPGRELLLREACSVADLGDNVNVSWCIVLLA